MWMIMMDTYVTRRSRWSEPLGTHHTTTRESAVVSCFVCIS